MLEFKVSGFIKEKSELVIWISHLFYCVRAGTKMSSSCESAQDFKILGIEFNFLTGGSHRFLKNNL